MPFFGGFWYYTLPETNIDPENGWLEDEFPLGKAYFRGKPLVSGRVIVCLHFTLFKLFRRVEPKT